MFLIITGPVASGKTTLANEIKKKFPFQKFLIVNDKDFAIKNDLGSQDVKTKEYEVDISKFSKKVLQLLNTKKNIIFDGHLFCEVSKMFLKKMDFIFVLKNSEKFLREKMKERNYDVLKIEENILCFKTNYFQNILSKKNTDFIEIQMSNDLKLDVKKINKYLQL